MLAQILPAQLMSSLQLLQSLLPCWLQHSQRWNVMSACVSMRGERSLISSVIQLKSTEA
jgi:hypothetical protein